MISSQKAQQGKLGVVKVVTPYVRYSILRP